MSWEQRRSIFLENSIGNKYFMYTAALSLLLVYSLWSSYGSGGTMRDSSSWRREQRTR